MREKLFEFLKVVVYPVFIYLNIDMEVVKVLCVLMVVDGFFGGIKAQIIYSSFEFKTFFWGFLIKILMLSIPALFALVGIGLGRDFTIFVDIAFKIMILSEFYSILGNLYSIKTRKEVDRVDVVTMMLKAVRDFIYGMIQNSIKKIQEAGDCETPKSKNNKDERNIDVPPIGFGGDCGGGDC